MSLDVLSLIIILLPGYWSLRVYERICFEDIHEEGDHSQFLLGLSFGILNLLLVWAFSNLYLFLLYNPYFSVDFREYYWSLPEIFDKGALFTFRFLLILGLLIAISPFTGSLWGILQRSERNPTEWIISKVSEKMEIGSRTKNSGNIDFIMDECLKSDSCFVRITTKESNEPIIGFLLVGNPTGIVLSGEGNFGEDVLKFFDDPVKVTYVSFESGMKVEYCAGHRARQWKYYEEKCMSSTKK